MSVQFKVNSVALPDPSDVRMEWLYLSEERRALDGTLHIDYRGRRRRITITWRILTPAEMTQIENLLSPWVPVTAEWTEPGGTVTITAIPRPQGRMLAPGRSKWDPVANRWWWADVGLVLEEI